MPIRIGDHDIARFGFLRPRADASQHVVERTRVEQIHTRTAAGIVEVIVLEPRHDGLSAGIEDSGGWSDQPSNLCCRSHSGKFSIRDRDAFRRREPGIYCVDLCIHDDQVGRFGLCVCSASRHKQADERKYDDGVRTNRAHGVGIFTNWATMRQTIS